MKQEVFFFFFLFYRKKPNFKYPPGKNTGTDLDTVCEFIKNIDKNYPPTDPRKYISCPSIINRNHDCNWFSFKKKMNTFVWDHDQSPIPKYKNHGEGTFNINPENGTDGFYIGEQNLTEIIKNGNSEISAKVAEHDQAIQTLNERVTVIEEEIHGGGIDEDKIVQTIENKGLSGGSSIIVQ